MSNAFFFFCWMLDIVNFTLSILWILLSFLKMCGDLVDNYVSQGYGLPSGHMWLWELDHKEGRMPENCTLHCGVGEDS